MSRSRLEFLVTALVTVYPHEIYSLIYSSSSFLFILSAYFVVLPLRDEGAISLGLSNLPALFVGSLLLTLVAAPVTTLIFSLPNLSKSKALLLIHRFFSISLVVFFILWRASSPENLHLETKGSVSLSLEQRDLKAAVHEDIPAHSAGWETHSWLYVSVRIGFFLWVALLNLLTISSTWARIIDVMDNESGSRLFGFIGAGATLGQLLGSLFATGFAWLGPYLLLVAALLMELAAQSSKGINKNKPHPSDELTPIRETDGDSQNDADGTIIPAHRNPSPKQVDSKAPAQSWAILDGLQLILSSNYLLQVSLFLWLSAVVSSFFYFQKVNVVAMTVTNAVGRRKLFGQINSFIAVFILTGQLTMTARILTIAGVTIAICSAPFVAFSNLIAVAVWPTWVVVAVSETIRKVTTYVVTRPARELLFTVVSEDEKYKAKICMDVIIQRLGDAAAAGMFKLLFSTLGGRISSVSLYALPVCRTLNKKTKENNFCWKYKKPLCNAKTEEKCHVREVGSENFGKMACEPPMHI